MVKNCSKEGWISFILRLSMVSLMGNAALGKIMMGPDKVVTMFTGMFKDTYLPGPLVAGYAWSITWMEALIAVWLLLGIRLKEGWVFTALTIISLAFGLTVTKSPNVADLYVYLLVACAGLYFSSYDECNLLKCCKK